ncbi:hypothetical protein ACMD2_26439 [Ananas comosus]|uniref:Uncharacterized protein n=1 Tax=Ananas comosus TaxID=4615 RepID=A0A199W1R6_ANACO|nr:hypothetical protein ACMD2_26439 [Ananas comosus]
MTYTVGMPRGAVIVGCRRRLAIDHIRIDRHSSSAFHVHQRVDPRRRCSFPEKWSCIRPVSQRCEQVVALPEVLRPTRRFRLGTFGLLVRLTHIISVAPFTYHLIKSGFSFSNQIDTGSWVGWGAMDPVCLSFSGVGLCRSINNWD